jgi:hypothetical protein
MLKAKRFSSYSSKGSVLIAIVTSLWVYLISDNPVKIILSLVIGFCCGIVAFFVFTEREFNLQFNKTSLFNGKILALLLLFFIFTSVVSPIDSIYVMNWFSLPVVNWFSFVLSFIFSFFVSGYVIISLMGVHSRVSFSASVILSVLVSMFFTFMFWFFVRLFSLSGALSFVLFSSVQAVLILAYFLKFKSTASEQSMVCQKRVLSLNVVFPLLAIVTIFVSLIVLQLFVYEPFVRGDSWNYVGTSIAITKGAFGVIPAGNF